MGTDKERDPAKSPPAPKPPDRGRTEPAQAPDESLALHERLGNAGALKVLNAAAAPSSDGAIGESQIPAPQVPFTPVIFDPREPWLIILPRGFSLDVLAMSLYGTMNVPLDLSVNWFDGQARLTTYPSLLRAPYRALHDAAMRARQAELDAECWANYQELKERIQLYLFARSPRPAEIVERWARESVPHDRRNYLDYLLDLCSVAIIDTGTIIESDRTIYDLLFDEYYRADDLAEIRDKHSRLFKGVEAEAAPSLLGELASHALEVPIGAVEGLGNAAVGMANMVKEGGLMLYDLGQAGSYVIRNELGLHPDDPKMVSAVGKAAEQGAGTTDILAAQAQGLIDAPKRVVEGIVEGDPRKATAAFTELWAFSKLGNMKIPAPAVIDSAIAKIASLPMKIPGAKPLKTAIGKVLNAKVPAPAMLDNAITGMAAAPGQVAAAATARLLSGARSFLTSVAIASSRLRVEMASPFVPSRSTPALSAPKSPRAPVVAGEARPASAPSAPVEAPAATEVVSPSTTEAAAPSTAPAAAPVLGSLTFVLAAGQRALAALRSGTKVFGIDHLIRFDIDEVLPVGDRSIKRQRAYARALSAYNRQLLERLTNQRTKYLGIDPRELRANRGEFPPVDVGTDPSLLFRRRFSEINELSRIFKRAVDGVKDPTSKSPGKLKEEINSKVREIIAEDPGPDAQAVRDALGQLGFVYVAGQGFTMMP